MVTILESPLPDRSERTYYSRLPAKREEKLSVQFVPLDTPTHANTMEDFEYRRDHHPSHRNKTVDLITSQDGVGLVVPSVVMRLGWSGAAQDIQESRLRRHARGS